MLFVNYLFPFVLNDRKGCFFLLSRLAAKFLQGFREKYLCMEWKGRFFLLKSRKRTLQWNLEDASNFAEKTQDFLLLYGDSLSYKGKLCLAEG